MAPTVVALLAVALLSTPAVAADRGGVINIIVNYGAVSRLDAARAIQREGGQVGTRFRLINAVTARVTIQVHNANHGKAGGGVAGAGAQPRP